MRVVSDANDSAGQTSWIDVVDEEYESSV